MNEQLTLLYQALDKITDTVKSMDERLVPVCGDWEFDKFDDGKPKYGVRRYANKFRIVSLAFGVPVTDCVVETRIEFALVSVEFMKAYEMWSVKKLQQLLDSAIKGLNVMGYAVEYRP